MNKVNYHKAMQTEIAQLGADRPKLLLHSCCGPCSTHCIQQLQPKFAVSVLFYNPNITEEDEYLKRKATQLQYLQNFPEITLLDCDYLPEVFFETTKGREKEKEGGARCYLCYQLRLEYTAKYAQQNQFSYFCSTLSVSPHKKSAWINQLGLEMQEKYNVKWLQSDFKKENGYLTSVRLAKENNLYRQNYCGCIYSKWQLEEENIGK